MKKSFINCKINIIAMKIGFSIKIIELNNNNKLKYFAYGTRPNIVFIIKQLKYNVNSKKIYI